MWVHPPESGKDVCHSCLHQVNQAVAAPYELVVGLWHGIFPKDKIGFTGVLELLEC